MRRSGACGRPLPEPKNRLKSERVQLELEAPHGVRKIVQRGACGRFIRPLVLPAEPEGAPVVELSILIEGALAAGGEITVIASLVPKGAGPEVEGISVKEVGHAAA